MDNKRHKKTPDIKAFLLPSMFIADLPVWRTANILMPWLPYRESKDIFMSEQKSVDFAKYHLYTMISIWIIIHSKTVAEYCNIKSNGRL